MTFAVHQNLHSFPPTHEGYGRVSQITCSGECKVTVPSSFTFRRGGGGGAKQTKPVSAFNLLIACSVPVVEFQNIKRTHNKPTKSLMLQFAFEGMHLFSCKVSDRIFTSASIGVRPSLGQDELSRAVAVNFVLN